LWLASQNTELLSLDFSLKCYRGDGTALWNVDPGPSGVAPGLCIGTQIAQPDLDR
jgi:hypothetical protein